MKILFAASEVAPFIKTGGLADVAGSLPAALAKAGHEVKVILPLYEGVGQQWRDQMTFQQHFNITLAWRHSYCGVFSLEKDGVTYWFVDNEYYFKRSDLYGHFDDGERFAYFSRAVVETPEHMGFYPDVIHCNDWQTALVPIYLLEERYRLHTLANARTMFTIHNIEYQGRYSWNVLEDIFGIDSMDSRAMMLEYYGDLNLMKGGICAADAVTTVSPTYAAELADDFYAHGLAGVVAANSHKLRGILNGLDVELNDPATDMALTTRFSSGDLTGKAACKAALQQAVGLNVDSRVPVVACVSRLVSHKGFDLVLDALQKIMGCDLQMVVLGTGNWHYEEAFRQAEQQYSGRFAACIQYSSALATAIYGGSDLFLMPSIAEPCGLSQMIAMRYGTVPIVRETGGLRDSVPPYDPANAAGLGFTFTNATAEDMLGAIYRAMESWYDHPGDFAALRARAMAADFSWTRSAQSYLELYHQITGIPANAGEPAPAEEPAPAPKKRASRAKKADDAPAEEKPRRGRKKKAETEAPAAETPAAETPAVEEKPRRGRKKKTETEAPAAETPAGEKPRRGRKKKAEAEAPAVEPAAAETPAAEE